MDRNLKKEPKQERSRFLLESIVEAAQTFYSQISYENISINKIAEKAGVSIGSLYQYFPSKDSIVDEIGRRAVGERIKEFEKRLEEVKGRPIEEALDKMIEIVCGLYFKHPQLMKTVFAKFPGWKSSTVVLKYRDQVFDLMVSRLNQTPAEALRPRNQKLAVFVLMNAVLAIIEAAVLRYPNDFSPEDLKAELSALCRGYLFKNEKTETRV